MNFYMWDVLNPDSIADGTGKPHLKERGPYAYREIRKKVTLESCDGGQLARADPS